jgi:signal transduction histidine kinase
LETARQDLQRVRSAATKMSGLLDGLLELSRIGRKLNLLTEFNLKEVILEAVENLSGKLQEKQPPIELIIHDDFPNVMGDYLRLVQVFHNLIDNAIKYMGDQPNPKIEIGWEDHDHEIWVYVKDNGIGIEPQNIDRIFNLYEKLDENVPGYGIGLTVVQRIIETHKGRLWVKSDGHRQGSAFWFSLPIFPSPEYPLTGGFV